MVFVVEGKPAAVMVHVTPGSGGNPATLIQQLPIPLSSIPNLAAVIPQLNLPAGFGSTGTLPSVTSILPGGKGGVVIPNPLPSGIASPHVKPTSGKAR